jgi:hypothetical protein
LKRGAGKAASGYAINKGGKYTPLIHSRTLKSRLSPLVKIQSAQVVKIKSARTTLGDVRPAEVRHVMHDIEDDTPVGPALDSAFDGRVVVKEGFRNRPGREFRKLFRAAGR